MFKVVHIVKTVIGSKIQIKNQSSCRMYICFVETKVESDNEFLTTRLVAVQERLHPLWTVLQLGGGRWGRGGGGNLTCE